MAIDAPYRLPSILGAVIELRCRSGRESRTEPSTRLSPIPTADLREDFRQRLRLHVIACSASQRRSNRIRCSRRAALREPLAVQRGGTRPAERGIRNRLSDGTRPVHVDQLRRRTLRTTKSLVTRRFYSFAASGRFRQRRLPGIEATSKSSPNRPLAAPPVRRWALHDPAGQLLRDRQPRTRARPPPARHRGRAAPEHAQPRLLARHRSPGLTPPSLHDAAAARRLLPDQLREIAGRSADHAHSGRQSPARPSRARLRSCLGFEVMTAAGPTNGETCRLLLLLEQATSSNSSSRDPNTCGRCSSGGRSASPPCSGASLYNRKFWR